MTYTDIQKELGEIISCLLYMSNLSQTKDFLQTRPVPAMAWNSCRILMIYGTILTIIVTCDTVVLAKKTRYRSMYAREVNLLKDKDISSRIIGEYRNIRSTSNCLNLCLNVQICLSFQFNNIEGRCRLYDNTFSNSFISQSGNRYFLALKGKTNLFGNFLSIFCMALCK